MILSRYNLKNISAQDIETPAESVFDLPEKVLQFGTGVLLRGLPDYFIDKANFQCAGSAPHSSLTDAVNRFGCHLPS